MQVRNASDVFDRKALKRICEMPETAFGLAYDMQRFEVAQNAPNDFYFYRNNGADILAVAHLDTVAYAPDRRCRFVETEAGTVVHSRALDDRLGAYIILEMLPRLGINVDLLLTVGEEDGQSTAQFFETHKQYNWMIEFDRGGTDVVMYQYDNALTRSMVRECGATPADGIFSDISYMEHLGIKGFNWGVGYRDYHGPRAHAYLEDTFEMVDFFQVFHWINAETHLPHVEDTSTRYGNWWGSRYHWGSALSREMEQDELEEQEAAERAAAWAAEHDRPVESVTDPFYWSET